MKFQKKIVLNYVIFSVLLALTFGIFYYTVNIRWYKEKEYGNIRTIADVKLQQMEDMLRNMQTVSTYLLSDQEVLESLSTLSSGVKGASRESIYFNSATETIRSQLNTWYLMSQFYRVVVFNRKGIVIANNNYSSTQLNSDVSSKDIPWLLKATDTKGRNVLIGLHKDDWGKRQTPEVLSVVKEIQGGGRGYIEVQQEKAFIDKMLGNGDEDPDYIVCTGDGEVLYAGRQALPVSYYRQLLVGRDMEVQAIRTQEGEHALMVENYSEKEDIVLLAVHHIDISHNAMRQALPLTVAVLLGFLLFSFGYVYLSARQLVKPIRLLQDFMENTQLTNLQSEIPENISNDEIETLYRSFKDVLRRLDESMRKEKRMSVLQLQSQFDLLQAQVNPHFIYNVLNVISNRGLENDDEVICDMCGDLAGMLRYATNTREKYATVEEEKQYLELYLGLLKYRYDYKLAYEIRIDERLYSHILPKIVLQQIVENSVTHGFLETTEKIRITVEGYEDEGGWYLKISDNGCGIGKERLKKIRQSMEEVKHKLDKDREHVEMEIGGMGLVNTCARLYLLYADHLVLEISSGEGEGTEVVLGVRGVGNTIPADSRRGEDGLHV